MIDGKCAFASFVPQAEIWLYLLCCIDLVQMSLLQFVPFAAVHTAAAAVVGALAAFDRWVAL